MAEVTAPQAAEIIDKSLMTVHRKIADGLLLVRQEGTGERKLVYVDVDDLRRFASQYGYRFNEKLAQQYAK
jgi:hypothetical protein